MKAPLLFTIIALLLLAGCSAFAQAPVQLTFGVQDSTEILQDVDEVAAMYDWPGWLIGFGGIVIAIMSLWYSSSQGKRNIKLAEASLRLAEETLQFAHRERAAQLRAELYNSRLECTRKADVAIQNLIRKVEYVGNTNKFTPSSVKAMDYYKTIMSEYWPVVAECRSILSKELLQVLTVAVPDAILPLEPVGGVVDGETLSEVSSKLIEAAKRFTKRARADMGIAELSDDIQQAILEAKGSLSPDEPLPPA